MLVCSQKLVALTSALHNIVITQIKSVPASGCFVLTLQWLWRENPKPPAPWACCECPQGGNFGSNRAVLGA